MPVHDWTRVDAGTFHDFHVSWVTHPKEALNGGILPSGYYAMAEQHGGRIIADILTLRSPPSAATSPIGEGGLAVAEAPPRVRHKLTVSSAAREMRRTVTIRHVSGDRVIALLEIVSPANKDRPLSVDQFANKAEMAIRQGIHVVLVDLLPPGPHDPRGMHGAIWERFDEASYLLPCDEPLTLASYVADRMPEAYLEHLAVGSTLVEMPLFLDLDRYVNLPLESTYMTAYRGMPERWRVVLEARQASHG